MFRVFLAMSAVLVQVQFFRRIDFITLCYVIGCLAHSAHQTDEKPLIFLCHSSWYYTVLFVPRQESIRGAYWI